MTDVFAYPFWPMSIAMLVGLVAGMIPAEGIRHCAIVFAAGVIVGALSWFCRP